MVNIGNAPGNRIMPHLRMDEFPRLSISLLNARFRNE